MTCAEVQKLLHDEPGHLPADATRHLQRCRSCQIVQQELLLVKDLLRQAPPPALPDGFELALRRRLVQESRAMRPVARRWVQAAVAMAAALAVVVGAMLVWKLRQAPTEKAPTPTMMPTVAMVSYHRLHLSVQNRAALPEALFDVELPDGAALVGGLDNELGGGRVVRWRSDLLPGINAIDLPIVLRQAQPAAVKVRARLFAAGKTFVTQATLRPGALSRRDGAPLKPIKLAWVIAAEVVR
jgi:anti-sigma factor RsiW